MSLVCFGLFCLFFICVSVVSMCSIGLLVCVRFYYYCCCCCCVCVFRCFVLLVYVLCRCCVLVCFGLFYVCVVSICSMCLCVHVFVIIIRVDIVVCVFSCFVLLACLLSCCV